MYVRRMQSRLSISVVHASFARAHRSTLLAHYYTHADTIRYVERDAAARRCLVSICRVSTEHL